MSEIQGSNGLAIDVSKPIYAKFSGSYCALRPVKFAPIRFVFVTGLLFFSTFTVAADFADLFNATGEAEAINAAREAQKLNAAREAERIQREEQLRLQQQFEKDQTSARPPAQIQRPTVEKTRKKPSQECQQIEAINFSGAKSLSPKEKATLARPYLSRCLGISEIEALLADITFVYIKKGLISARAYLPQQDLADGDLRILVIEGKVSDIKINQFTPGKKEPDPSIKPLLQSNIFPGVVGQPLNLRDIEQGIDQLNRLASNNAVVDIKPGFVAGESLVVINNQASKKWHALFNLDNQGSRSTGKEQAAVTLSYDNLLGINDFISLTRRQSVPVESGEKSSSESYSYVVPYGYHTVSLGVSNSRYESTLTTNSGLQFITDGTSNSHFIRHDYLAWRNQKSRLNVTTTLTSKESENFLAGQLLTVSSRRLSVLDVGASLSTQFGGGLVSFNIGYSRGLKLFDALEDVNFLPEEAPRAQFEKYSYSASYSKGVKLLGQDIKLSTRLSGQHAVDALYGSEQISAGGIYSVRGFYEKSIAGDHGFYLRNDISVQKQLKKALMGKPIVIKPYLAIDAGKVDSVASGVITGEVVGAAIGLSVFSGGWVFDSFIGQPLSQADDLGDKEGSNAFFRLSYNL